MTAATAMIGDVYDALLEAGASPEKARKAAEAVASFDSRASKVEIDAVSLAADGRGQVNDLRLEIAAFRQESKSDVADLKQDNVAVRSEMRLHRWMLGATFAGVIGILLRLFFP